ncbi:MAG: biotin--[acetyl-CoA-carboxylase] ligase [Reichenbachiella sp.]|uniref:biotin--[acetyl-CoA-carboxylase] ligase n=1 Tax=Reichenbachiella sp. TaxID=2184521 RepID=UPI003267A686
MHKIFAKTQFLGKKVVFLPECHSTNDTAVSILKKKPQLEGTTIITSHQTHGRGQRGNSWESEPGKNATFSIILHPTIVPAIQQFQLHIISTLAIYATLFPVLGKKLKIKWPNDIFYGESKLGGILIENVLKGQNIESSVVGIGLNVNQTHFINNKATSILDISGQKTEIDEIIEKILVNLEKKYLELKKGKVKLLESQYLARLYRFKVESIYETSGRIFRGSIVGVNQNGLLKIKEDEMIHEFAFKEVTYK